MTQATERRCSLAEMGIVCALGTGAEEVWPRLRSGDVAGLVERDLGTGSRPFGMVPGPLPSIDAPMADLDCRNNRLALAALRQIEHGVARTLDAYGAERIAVIMGTSTSGLSDAETAFARRTPGGELPEPFSMGQLEHGGLAEFVARACGARGPRYTISTACSSGAKAIAAARTLLDMEVADAVVAGGVDSLCGITVRGFGALQAVSRRRTNPMSLHRDGLSLGEGGAIFLMTREPGAIQLLGSGESSDAHHMSAPEPTGAGMAECMRSALADAGVGPEAIAYANLHGTGTPQNDATEAIAVAEVLGTEVPCSSTKPLTGHTLGASGALEAAFCWLILAHRDGADLWLPPHRWDGVADPRLPRLNLVGDAKSAPGALLLSNSFGFGGTNCCLVLGGNGSCAPA